MGKKEILHIIGGLFISIRCWLSIKPASLCFPWRALPIRQSYFVNRTSCTGYLVLRPKSASLAENDVPRWRACPEGSREGGEVRTGGGNMKCIKYDVLGIKTGVRVSGGGLDEKADFFVVGLPPLAPPKIGGESVSARLKVLE